jgi:protease-4
MSFAKRLFRGILYTWAALGGLVMLLAVGSWLQRSNLLLPTDAVEVVEVEGVIEDADETVAILDQVAKNDGIRSVVLRVNSPGGAVAPTQEIYDAVMRVRERKPIIASLSGLAASGGYYVAAACDAIVSNPGSLTGSIGVIMQFGNLEELLDTIGLAGFVLKAGKYKDVGSPLRPMGDDERALLQTLLENVHEQFIQAIAQGRGLPVERVLELADGRIYSGQQAFEAGLVDRLGGLHEAVALAAEQAGIQGEPKTVSFKSERSPWWLSHLFGSLSRAGGELIGLRFLYLGPHVSG